MKKNGYSRRDFLKVLGASGGLAASGCAPELPEKIIPYVVQPSEIVPGVATWYSGSCNECSAGCGVHVRVREGRVVKLEANNAHPINPGGLCVRGHSALQAHYDPDRVREPLVRKANSPFQPKSWDDAVASISAAIENTGDKEVVLVTKPTSGSIDALIAQLRSAVPRLRHIEYSTEGEELQARAAEKYFGSSHRVHYDLEKADTIVSLGADYLETWLSPAEFSRAWAKRRKPDHGKEISYCAHIDSRLSLTAANSDTWISSKPGSEVRILLALLKAISSGQVRGPGTAQAEARRITSGLNVAELLVGTGVGPETVAALAKKLSASTSLVLAGGASISGSHALTCASLSLLINDLLGNVGSSVVVYRSEKKEEVQSSYDELLKLAEDLQAEESKVGVVLLADVNPVYSLPSATGFKKALSKAPFVVSLTTALTETSKIAQAVLPLSTSLESWGDSQPRPGVYNLNQPAMAPLYKTQSLGDCLIAIASKLGVEFAKKGSYYDFIRSEWKKRLGESNFESRWLDMVEVGGQLEPLKHQGGISRKSLAVNVDSVLKSHKDGLSLVAFPTVRSLDGSTANRPWVQELPDPLSNGVWGSWVDVHPDTAKEHGISDGSVAQVKTTHGSLQVPVRVTDHVHPAMLAIPIGQGHSTMGRYAAGVGVNPFELLDPKSSEGAVSLVADHVSIFKAVQGEELVTTQHFYDQFDRGIYRTVPASKIKGDDKHHKNGHDDHGHDDHGDAHGKKNGHGNGHGDDHKGDGHGDGHHAVGHHDPLALGPQKEPKQMYKQFKEPLYRWGMSIDLASCTGCSACVVACYSENNIPVVGKEFVAQGREMSWLRIQHYKKEKAKNKPIEGFMPMMCQHCGNAPCEPVCPVYATYHSDEGLNHMVYNRCVGTRYCGNNCSYKVRRFNWFQYEWPEPLNWQLNPDVTVRALGVMEKCTFCVQRIREGQNTAKDEGREVRDGEVQPACASSCPTGAITFGNLNDKKSQVYKNSQSERGYKVLDAHINTQPATTYLARVKNDKVKIS